MLIYYIRFYIKTDSYNQYIEVLLMILSPQVQTLMDRFETQFENLDVQTQVMEGAMQDSSTLSTPQGEVDSLMQQVADEAGYVNLPLLRHGDNGTGNIFLFSDVERQGIWL